MEITGISIEVMDMVNENHATGRRGQGISDDCRKD